MPAPTTYTEAGLMAYMVDMLGATGVDLELNSSAPIMVRGLYATLRACGATEIEDVVDMGRLEAFALREAWRCATFTSASLYAIATPQGTNNSMHQINQQCEKMLERATQAARAYPDATYVIRIGKLAVIDDPYVMQLPEEWQQRLLGAGL